ncbi:MAG: alpha-L-fucosidase, partial [Clostridia bacterium]|nr:alpha-L-fucosidase [Clostridia bacterium]
MNFSKTEYERELARTRPQRMDWWKKARFGMFIHYGLYSLMGRHEWVQVQENIPKEEYELLARRFAPKEGCCRQWARLAKEAGMKYMVLTTRHHEGFSLWNSGVNPYNSMNACGRDIVREFVDACREFGLGVGLYFSLMDWHHPDGGICAYDTRARERFLAYTEALCTELLTNYGKIDVLWFD